MLNPHVNRVHIPAHILGISSICYFLFNPSFFTIIGFLVFNFWFSALGMSIGFHRYFTHKAFEANKFWRIVMLMGGTLAGQGSVIFWTALHRLHHPNSDKETDVHSPRVSFFHAYMGWIFTLDPSKVPMNRAVDLIKDPICKFTHRHYHRILWSWWILLVSICFLFSNMIPFIVGIFIAGMWSIHQEAIINSVCHNTNVGIATYQTNDDSRDVHSLHYLTWGQSLHNTHHANAASANFGTEDNPDIGYRIIKLIQK